MGCELTDRELDAFIAEKVMGWERHDWKNIPGEPVIGVAYAWDLPDGKNRWDYFPTRDLNACHEAEKSLSGTKDEEYAHQLAKAAVFPEAKFDDMPRILWFGLYNISTATARQRCEAMWEVMSTNPPSGTALHD